MAPNQKICRNKPFGNLPKFWGRCEGLSRFMLPFFQKEKEAFLFGKPLLFHGIYNFRE
jgi:hypothetical protein